MTQLPVSPDPMGSAARQSFAHWSETFLNRCERALDRYLPDEAAVPQRLHQAMRYACTGGGKRVRPLLVYASAQAVLAGAGSDWTRDRALDAAACAVEMIHAYSLVHDDLPCMDDDDLRRGKPTVHKQFDEATAMLVGDALQALAFQTLADIGAGAVGASLKELGIAAGAAGMAGGQAIDLMSVGQQVSRAQLEQMHRLKTGAMLSVSVRLGCMAATASGQVPRALEKFASDIGLAFQVVDDILDVEGDSATLGKTAGKDAAANKPTYVSLMGLKAARDYANSLHQQALAALIPFGDAAQPLRGIADFVVLRKH